MDALTSLRLVNINNFVHIFDEKGNLCRYVVTSAAGNGDNTLPILYTATPREFPNFQEINGINIDFSSEDIGRTVFVTAVSAMKVFTNKIAESVGFEIKNWDDLALAAKAASCQFCIPDKKAKCVLGHNLIADCKECPHWGRHKCRLYPEAVIGGLPF